MAGAPRGPRAGRETLAERRARRAAVDDPELILGAAARFLEARSRSVHEVRRRLTGAGYRTELVEDAITRLLGLGILDDAAFAQGWIESRDRSRPRGEHALRRELRLKGVDRAIVDDLLAERAEGTDAGADQAGAMRLLSRHAAALARVTDPRARRQRAYGLLARNGFDPETCATIVRQFLSDEEPDES